MQKRKSFNLKDHKKTFNKTQDGDCKNIFHPAADSWTTAYVFFTFPWVACGFLVGNGSNCDIHRLLMKCCNGVLCYRVTGTPHDRVLRFTRKRSLRNFNQTQTQHNIQQGQK